MSRNRKGRALQRGMTLIEIMVVVVILGLIAAAVSAATSGAANPTKRQNQRMRDQRWVAQKRAPTWAANSFHLPAGPQLKADKFPRTASVVASGVGHWER